MDFLEIDNHPGELSSYDTQCQLVELLRAVFEENGRILADGGFDHPNELGGLFNYPESALPDELLQARRIIEAAGSVWRSLFHGDKVQAASDGVWFGLMLGPEQFRKYKQRIAKQPRSRNKKNARRLFNSKSYWKSAKDFQRALDREEIQTTGYPQVQRWFTEFKKN